MQEMGRNSSRNKLRAQHSEQDLNIIAPTEQLINLNALMEDEGDSPIRHTGMSVRTVKSFGRLSKHSKLGHRSSVRN